MKFHETSHRRSGAEKTGKRRRARGDGRWTLRPCARLELMQEARIKARSFSRPCPLCHVQDEVTPRQPHCDHFWAREKWSQLNKKNGAQKQKLKLHLSFSETRFGASERVSRYQDLNGSTNSCSSVWLRIPHSFVRRFRVVKQGWDTIVQFPFPE